VGHCDPDFDQGADPFCETMRGNKITYAITHAALHSATCRPRHVLIHFPVKTDPTWANVHFACVKDKGLPLHTALRGYTCPGWDQLIY